MYKNFIFDLYGTLIDIHTDEDSSIFLKSCSDFLRAFGCNYSAQEFGSTYRKLVDKEAKSISGTEFAEIDLYKVFHQMISDKIEGDADKLVPYFMRFFRLNSTEYLRLYPEIISILEFLKKNGKHVYLLSNAQAGFTLPELKDTGIYDYFDDIFISSIEGYKKPSAEFMKRLLAKHKLEISESIMVGNDWYCDVAVADAVGMDSFYVHTDISPELTGKETASYLKLTGEPLTLSDFTALVK